MDKIKMENTHVLLVRCELFIYVSFRVDDKNAADI